MTALQPVVAKHASSSGGHFYDQHGNQINEVPNAKGDKLIKCTLRQARKLDLAPGVTTIINCADKPGLLRWMLDQAIMAAATEPRKDGDSDEQWLARVHQTREEKSREAREEGTRIHAAVQAGLQGGSGSVPAGYEAHYAGVRAVTDNLPAGNWVLDMKGKDGPLESLQKEKTYPEHHRQLAATAQALLDFGVDTKGEWASEQPCVCKLGVATKADICRVGGPGPVRCAIVFVSRDHPGHAWPVEVKDDELERGWSTFKALLTYWQESNRYRPSWARREA